MAKCGNCGREVRRNSDGRAIVSAFTKAAFCAVEQEKCSELGRRRIARAAKAARDAG